MTGEFVKIVKPVITPNNFKSVIEILSQTAEALKANTELDVIVEDLLNQCISPNLLVTQGKGGDNVSAIVIKLPPNAATSA